MQRPVRLTRLSRANARNLTAYCARHDGVDEFVIFSGRSTLVLTRRVHPPCVSWVGQGANGQPGPNIPRTVHSPTLLQLAAELFMDAHNGHFAFELLKIQVQN